MTMTTCKECEGAVSDNANTCPQCGAPVPKKDADPPLVGLMIEKMSLALFWKMVRTCFFWGLAAIPAAFVLMLIYQFYFNVIA